MRMKILLQVLFWLLKSLYLSNLRICLLFFFKRSDAPRDLHSFPTRRSSDLPPQISVGAAVHVRMRKRLTKQASKCVEDRSEEHTSELQSRGHLVCRLLLEKKNNEAGEDSIFKQVANILETSEDEYELIARIK